MAIRSTRLHVSHDHIHPLISIISSNEISKGGADMEEIYMTLYSPSTNSWIYISDLPAPRSVPAVAVLSSTEILLIGGYSDGDIVNTASKGTLQLV
jgi:hypothetical protein